MQTQGAVRTPQSPNVPATPRPPRAIRDQLSLSNESQQFRSHVGQISRQSGVFFAGTIFTAAASYAFKVYLARVLGAEVLGLYALGATLVGFIAIFDGLGLSESVVRYVPVYREAEKFRELHALLWSGSGIMLFSSIGSAALLLLFGPGIATHFYHAPELRRYLPLFAAMMVCSGLSVFYGKTLVGYKQLAQRTMIINFMGVPLMMVLSIGLITAVGGLDAYLGAQVLSGLIILVLLILSVRALTPYPARFFAQPWARIPHEVWTFSGAVLGVGAMEFTISQVDKVALGHFQGARQVGIYSVAAAMVAYVPLVLHSVNQIFCPTIADLHARGEHAVLGRLFQSLTKWVVGLTLPMATVIIVFARPLMRIFGHEFEMGWPILVIGTVGQLVNCGVGSVGYLLLMSGNEKRLIRVQALMTTVMIALSALLIPVWGIIGAAIAAAATNIGINVLNLWQVRRVLKISPYNRSYVHLIAPSLAALAVAGVVRMNIPLLRHEWLAIGVASVLAYMVFACVAVSFGLDADDRLIGRAIWVRVRAALPQWPGGVL